MSVTMSTELFLQLSSIVIIDYHEPAPNVVVGDDLERASLIGVNGQAAPTAEPPAGVSNGGGM